MSHQFIFGTGKVLEEHIDEIRLHEVEAFVDNDSDKWGKRLYGRLVISPEELQKREIDTVYVASHLYFSEIYLQLVERLEIPKEHVKGLSAILPYEEVSLDGDRAISSYEGTIESLFDTLIYLGVSNVYVDADDLRAYGVLSPYDKRLKAWRETGGWAFSDVLYDSVDAVLFVDPLEQMTLGEWIMKIHRLQGKTDAPCIFHAGGRWDNSSAAWLAGLRHEFPWVEARQYADGMVVIVRKVLPQDAWIFTVMHKPYVPVFGAQTEAGYTTILAGAQGKSFAADFRDDEGENISFLNAKINECTAMYWIWKHEHHDIIGLCHYRRYFLNRDGAKTFSCNLLSADGARRYLRGVDILLAKPVTYDRHDGVRKGMEDYIQPEAFQAGWEAILRNLRKYQPEYVDTFQDVMHGVEMYPCNMFVTRWEIFDAYCMWLFSFLIPAAEETDVSGFDDYSCRIIGFFAERMLTVWLLRQGLLIKTLPVLQTSFEK